MVHALLWKMCNCPDILIWLCYTKTLIFFREACDFFQAVSAEIVCWRNAIEYILWVRKGGAALFLFAHISVII